MTFTPPLPGLSSRGLVRVALDLVSNQLIIERGSFVKGGIELSEEQAMELEALRQQLEPYGGDFTSFKDVPPEDVEKIVEAKRRLAALEGLAASDEHLVWTPVADVRTVVLISTPRTLPIYVENMPSEWIEKLLSQQMIIENPQIYVGGAAPISREASGYPRDPNLSERGNLVRETIWNLYPKNMELLEISENAGIVSLFPTDWLDDKWSPIDKALKSRFKDAEWKSKGTGDKMAHWEVP
ncbi:hypothetical protein KKH23_06500 [Patescibacteria group bacterium]|uniref:Uncharacterized protein n=1 Tax=viral metagenome TaxID=1070528 RepID=A0A6M3M8L0_9ZZZZ|nr:hypothetical protein [Patescibacteria group bacterium]